MSFTRLYPMTRRRGSQEARSSRVRSAARRARRASSRVRPRLGRAGSAGQRDGASAPTAAHLRAYPPRLAAAPPASAGELIRDVASARVREAGGPIDEASYTCGCGYVFLARVSTSVTCPHCGAGQAW